MRLLLVGWDSQVRVLSNIAAKSIAVGNEVCLVVDKQSSLYPPAVTGFNPQVVLIAVPNEKIEARVLSMAVQAKEKNIPYVFYVRSLQKLDCISQTDVYKHCKAVFVPDDQGRRIGNSDGGPVIISIAYTMEIIRRCKELA